MRYRVKPDWLNPFKIIFGGIFAFLFVSFFCFIGLCIILAVMDIKVDIFLDDYGFLILIVLIFLAIWSFFDSYKSDQLTKYRNAIRNAYKSSIKEALKTEYSVSQIGEIQNQKPIPIWSKSLGVFH